MLSKTAWFKILIVKIQNLRVLDRFKAQDRFKASKGTVLNKLSSDFFNDWLLNPHI